MSLAQIIDTKDGYDSIVASVPGSSSHTHKVPLGSPVYSFGHARIYVPTLASSHDRNVSKLLFTRETSECVAQSTTQNSVTLLGYSPHVPYTFTNWAHKGYFYSDDTKLSDAFFNEGSGLRVRIESMRINGSDLDVVLQNIYPAASPVELELQYRVYRVHNKT